MSHETAFKTREIRETRERRETLNAKSRLQGNPRTTQTLPRLLDTTPIKQEEGMFELEPSSSTILSVKDAQSLMSELNAPPRSNENLRNAAIRYLRGLRARNEQ